MVVLAALKSHCVQSVSLKVLWLLGLGGQEDGDFCIFGIKILGYPAFGDFIDTLPPMDCSASAWLLQQLLAKVQDVGADCLGWVALPSWFLGVPLEANFFLLLFFLSSHRGCHSHPL